MTQKKNIIYNIIIFILYIYYNIYNIIVISTSCDLQFVFTLMYHVPCTTNKDFKNDLGMVTRNYHFVNEKVIFCRKETLS